MTDPTGPAPTGTDLNPGPRSEPRRGPTGPATATGSPASTAAASSAAAGPTGTSTSGARPGHSRSTKRRIDPAGKQALFSAPPSAARDQLGPGNQKDGRDAFFSTGPRQTGTVVVTCSDCATRSRVTLLDLGVRLLSISVWFPGRKHSHWMRCPGCHQHTWCDIGWNQ